MEARGSVAALEARQTCIPAHPYAQPTDQLGDRILWETASECLIQWGEAAGQVPWRAGPLLQDGKRCARLGGRPAGNLSKKPFGILGHNAQHLGQVKGRDRHEVLKGRNRGVRREISSLHGVPATNPDSIDHLRRQLVDHLRSPQK